MKFDIITAILLGLWPAMLLLSIMMLGAPGSSNSPRLVFLVTALLAYPVLLFLIRLVLQLPFFGLSALWSFIAVGAVLAALLFQLGFVRMALNVSNGIANEGYSINESGVYYNGEKLKDANPKTFEILKGSAENPADARDGETYFRHGQVIKSKGL